MEKILFASDLDGTLLNNRAIVSAEYAKILNDLVDQGCLFTVATAREPGGVHRALDPTGVCLSGPAVCLNGSLLWDYTADLPVQWFALERGVAETMIETVLRHQARGWMFVVNEEGVPLSNYYRDDISLDPRMLAYLRAIQAPYMRAKPLSEYRGGGEVL